MTKCDECGQSPNSERRADQLEALCRKLTEACFYGLNLTLNGVGQHSHAIALFEAALSGAAKLEVNP